MIGYLYSLGDIVCFQSRSLSARTVPDFFEITALMPLREGKAQYRVRSEYERYERVVLEDDIELVDDIPANSNIPAHMRKI